MAKQPSSVFFRFTTSIIGLLFLIQLIQLPHSVHGTNVKWTGNNDPDAPLASKVPRSQKYWDENNIERPDYAKTDEEIASEKKSKSGGKRGNSSNRSSGISSEDGKSWIVRKVLKFIIGGLFVSSWVMIYKFGMGMNRGGARLGSSTSTDATRGNNLLNYALKMKKKEDSESLEERARKARLARFETSTKED